MSLKEAIELQSKTKKVNIKHKSNGFILYEGASRLDPSQNIVAIVTNKSANPKTGNMAQLWILTKDINPLTASKEKKDNAKLSVIILLSKTDSSMQILTKKIIRYKRQGAATVFLSCIYHKLHFARENTIKLCFFLKDSNIIIAPSNEIRVTRNKRVRK